MKYGNGTGIFISAFRICFWLSLLLCIPLRGHCSLGSLFKMNCLYPQWGYRGYGGGKGFFFCILNSAYDKVCNCTSPAPRTSWHTQHNWVWIGGWGPSKHRSRINIKVPNIKYFHRKNFHSFLRNNDVTTNQPKIRLYFHYFANRKQMCAWGYVTRFVCECCADGINKNLRKFSQLSPTIYLATKIGFQKNWDAQYFSM